jgi:hypothetical protein
MPYISKAKREATSWLTRLDLIKHVQEATGYHETETYKQISEAIEDCELPVVWGDLLESFWKKGGSGFAIQKVDKPPRNPQFWRQGAFDPADPRKGQFDPDDADRLFVGWDYDFDDPDVREPRFRKPMFWRDRAEDIWRLPNATALDEKKAVDFLGEKLKKDSELRREDALNMCRQQFPKLGVRGSLRVWPRAREAAGLEAKARPGRKKQK